jgi:hypothetical protein
MTVPHVHTITLFDVAKIVVEFDGETHCQTVRFIGSDPNTFPNAVTVHAWQGSGDHDRAPELVLHNQPKKETENAVECQPETD